MSHARWFLPTRLLPTRIAATRRARIRFGAVAFAVSALVATPRANSQVVPKAETQALHFRFVGPMHGNRVAAGVGVPGNPNVYYAGASSGGVWKSSDGGLRWRPVFDHEPVQAIGALAVAPSAHNEVWAGTGEAWLIRASDMSGDGVYRSLDAGRTWQHMGLTNTGRIGRIVVNPRNANEVYVCALGHAADPGPDRGVYRTTDGGKTWQRILYVAPDAGCSGLAMDPHNPNKLFAGFWQVKMRPWALDSGGPNSGIFVSHDGGNHWTRLVHDGLPHSPLGKIDVAVAPTNSNRVYALIQTHDQGSLWRSDDGGRHWHVENWNRDLIGRAGYYIRLAVSPADENTVYIANSSFWISSDGGETFHPTYWGGDNHDIWVDPQNAKRIIVTDDGGINITTNGGKGFHRVGLPIGQMYHVAVDNQIPFHFYTNMQDAGTMRGPSIRTQFGYGVPPTAGWTFNMGGCESGFTLPDPKNPNIVWASCYGDEVTRWNAKTGLARSVSPWLHTLDSPPNKTKYRCNWTPPLAIDPFDANTVYYGCQVIFKTSDKGQSWSIISPDLSTGNPKYLQPSGGFSEDNLGQFYGETIFAIAPSPIRKDLIWAGTNDGQVWYTTAGGGKWTNVTKNIHGIGPWGEVTSIAPSPFAPGTAYVSITRRLMGDWHPYIFMTTDYGRTWTNIATGIGHGADKTAIPDVQVVCADPYRRGLLFAGTSSGLFFTLDNGAHWAPLNHGLPHTKVSWAVIQRQTHDLVVSTYGRGIYILDDVAPLERMSPADWSATAHLFAPTPAYRLPRIGHAIFDYSVGAATHKPVTLTVLDAQGHVVRTLHGPGSAGLHRVFWDMRYAPAQTIKLRTPAPDNPYIYEEPQFWGHDWRPIIHWGIWGANRGPMAAPGRYTLRLVVGGQTYTRPFSILRDPKDPATVQQIEASVRLGLRVRADIDHVTAMVDQLEWMRKQLNAVYGMLRTTAPGPLPASVRAVAAGRAGGSRASLLASVAAMRQRMSHVEDMLIAREDRNSDDKYYTQAYRPYLNLIWFNAEIGPGGGDVAGSAGEGPTRTAYHLLHVIEAQLAKGQSAYDSLMGNEMVAFNRSLARHGLTPVVASAPPPVTEPSGR